MIIMASDWDAGWQELARGLAQVPPGEGDCGRCVEPVEDA